MKVILVVQWTKNNINGNIERVFLLALKITNFIELVFVALGPNFAHVLIGLYIKHMSDENAAIAVGYYCNSSSLL